MPPINHGSQLIGSLCVGAQIVSAAYVGSSQVFGGGGPVAYLGPVASRTALPMLYSTSVKQTMCGSVHIAEDAISAMSLVYPGYYVTTTGVETAFGAATTLHVGVEYPIGGVVTELLWGGNTTGSVASGEQAQSDLTTLHATIPAGAAFRIRCWASNSVGLGYTDTIRNTTSGQEFFAYGATATDASQSGTLTNTSGSAQTMYLPVAILGMTSKRTVVVFGDSKGFGTADTYSGSEVIKGLLNRGLRSAGIAAINATRPSVRAEHFNASAVRQIELAAYCTDVVCQYAINDIIAGRTSAVINASLSTMWGKFSGKHVRQVLCTPYTNAGNTAALNEAVRDPVNSYIAGAPSPLVGVINLNGILEASDLWASSGYTADGTHELRAANVAVADSGIIATALGF